ncbi:hypothetical protein K9N68_02010 [Kovacikia minuta CCNUW1]|uniref:PAS domain-containing protein n=1 Tax=Kovacikia minuta TaxID=2931930 RepID=UPI001CCA1ECC|nr:PAS domain-containing protein [Kovacikia minuta]UBF26792.1 hypothetical protein K9N68_02010 [Kovacikia minuta CCNUW1]
MVNKKYLDQDRGGQFPSDERLVANTAFCQSSNHDYADADILHLSTFFRNNPNPILIFSPTGDVVKANPAAERLLKRIQIQETDLLPADHRQIVAACLEGRLKEHAVEVTVNDRVFALTYHSLSSFRMVYLYAIEITEYRRAEADLLRIASNTVALAKLAVSRLQAFRTTLPQPAHPPSPQDAFADLFVAMDGCVFSASNGSGEGKA